MRVYIAAPWVRKPEAIEVGKRFEAAGHVVTSRWFNHVGDPNDSTGFTSDFADIQHQAAEDMFDVLSSEALVVLNLERSEGKAVETGIALAAGLVVISVGPRSNIFQTMGLEVATVEEALAALEANS